MIAQYKETDLARYNTFKQREKREDERLEQEILDINNAENLSTNIPTGSNASKETKPKPLVKKTTMIDKKQIILDNIDQKPDISVPKGVSAQAAGGIRKSTI